MQETLIIVNSDPKAGSKNLTDDGSSFYVDFSERLETSGNPTIKVLSASIWFNFPNIKTGINDTLTIRFGNDGSTVTAFTNSVTITLPQGLYDIDHFSSAVSEAIHDSQYGSELGTDSVIFTPNYATSKAQVTLSIENLLDSSTASFIPNYIEVDFQNSSVAPLLGFTQNARFTVAYGAPIKSDTFESQTIADMAPVSSLIIKCSAARGSIINGNMQSDTIAAIPILAEVGHQILYSPFQTPRTSCAAFKNGVNQMRMSLCDQNGNPVNTNGEYWSAALLLEW